MIALFNLLLENPHNGVLILIIFFSIYLWREQGKIKAEIRTMERFLDDKKLDKQEFSEYSKTHLELHKSFTDHLKTAISLLKKGE